jgi:hypothetical protein
MFWRLSLAAQDFFNLGSENALLFDDWRASIGALPGALQQPVE